PSGELQVFLYRTGGRETNEKRTVLQVVVRSLRDRPKKPGHGVTGPQAVPPPKNGAGTASGAGPAPRRHSGLSEVFSSCLSAGLISVSSASSSFLSSRVKVALRATFTPSASLWSLSVRAKVASWPDFGSLARTSHLTGRFVSLSKYRLASGRPFL